MALAEHAALILELLHPRAAPERLTDVAPKHRVLAGRERALLGTGREVVAPRANLDRRPPFRG
jgi:hypothetical protein